MRASLLVPCALAFALAGCKGTATRREPRRSEVTSAAAAPEEAHPYESFYDPDAEGRAALSVRNDSPNMRYARLGREACVAELGRRGIAFEEAPASEWARRSRAPIARVDKVATKPKNKAPMKRMGKPQSASGVKSAKQGKAAKLGAAPKTAAHTMTTVDASEGASVLAPVRLSGPLHGIAIHSGLPEKARAKSSIEVFDCRLVLALDDFSSMLAKHDVVEIVHMSAFRSERDRGCTPKYMGKQHCGALAVDVGIFKKRDGSVLDVDKDFNGRIGTATCTAGTAPNPATPAATELWDIVCESARRGLFHVVLTPNFNAEHKNHFHLEVTPDVQWMLIK